MSYFKTLEKNPILVANYVMSLIGFDRITQILEINKQTTFS